MAMLTCRYKERERKGMLGYQYTSLGCSRINEEGEQDAEFADGYFDQGQENCGVLHFNLSSFKTKVECLQVQEAN